MELLELFGRQSGTQHAEGISSVDRHTEALEEKGGSPRISDLDEIRAHLLEEPHDIFFPRNQRFLILYEGSGTGRPNLYTC